MRTIRYAAGCTLLMLVAFIAGRTMSAPQAPALSPDVETEHTQITDVFRKVRIESVPLTEAAKTLSKLYECDIRVDTKGLEQSGLESDRLVSFTGDDVNLATAVRGLGVEEGLRGYFAVELRGKELVLTAAAYAWVETVVRVYDIENLVLLRMAARGVFPADDESDGFFLPRSSPHLQEAEEARAWLRNVVIGKLAPGTWIDDGGQIASAGILDSYLIVRQSPDVQIAIAALLNELFENDLKRLANRKALIRLLQQADEKANR